MSPRGPCATSTSDWTGVRLRDVLELAGMRVRAGRGEELGGARS